MTTDFRALCAELLDWAEVTAAHYIQLPAVMLRARAALADEPASVTKQPTVMQIIELSDEIEAAGLGQVDFAHAVLARWGNPTPQLPASVAKEPRPTDQQLKTFACEWWHKFGFVKNKATCTWVIDEIAPEHFVDFMRSVLARWGNPAPQPVPVSERLPRPEDCDAEGKCWWGRSGSDYWSADWTLATHEAVAEFCEFYPQTVWLPAHALPLPTVND